MTRYVLFVGNPAQLGRASWVQAIENLKRRRVVGRWDVWMPYPADESVENWHESAEAVLQLQHPATRRGVISREGTAAYLRMVESGEIDGIRAVAIKLLDRFDETGTFRLVDRETAFQDFALVTLSKLSENPPDLVIFPVTPHEFNSYVIWKVSEFLGIETLFFQPCPVAPTVFPMTNNFQPIDVGSGAVKNFAVGTRVGEIARTNLQRLVSPDDPVYIADQKISHSRAKSVFGKVRFLRWVILHLRWPKTGREMNFSGIVIRRGLLLRIIGLFLKRLLQNSLRVSEALNVGENFQNKNYALLLLHYEPERTSIPEGGDGSQVESILLARALLPREQVLVVKEHSSQLSSSLKGYVSRDPGVYRLIERMPGVVRISANQSSKRWLSRATGVFTGSGTIGLEAALQGIPVAYFGHPWWAGCPGTSFMTGLSGSRPFESLEISSSGAVREYLLNKIMSQSIPGIGSEEAHVIERRQGGLPPGLFDCEVSALEKVIAGQLEIFERQG